MIITALKEIVDIVEKILDKFPFIYYNSGGWSYRLKCELLFAFFVSTFLVYRGSKTQTVRKNGREHLFAKKELGAGKRSFVLGAVRANICLGKWSCAIRPAAL